jgi:hypothetical protein
VRAGIPAAAAQHCARRRYDERGLHIGAVAQLTFARSADRFRLVTLVVSMRVMASETFACGETSTAQC